MIRPNYHKGIYLFCRLPYQSINDGFEQTKSVTGIARHEVKHKNGVQDNIHNIITNQRLTDALHEMQSQERIVRNFRNVSVVKHKRPKAPDLDRVFRPTTIWYNVIQIVTQESINRKKNGK